MENQAIGRQLVDELHQVSTRSPPGGQLVENQAIGRQLVDGR